MKTRLLLVLFLSFTFYVLSSQVPQGFNYQAIARDASGNPIAGATIKVKLSILSDTTGFYVSGTGTYLWEEEQINVKTNSSGLFTVVLGNPSATKIQGSVGSFSAIPWSTTPLFIGTKIANPAIYKNMGAARLWTVPYSMVSGSLSGTLSKLAVKSTQTSPDSALFEVKNNKGQTIFAVYNKGIRAYVDTVTVKGSTKGGFAIGGFGDAKAPSQPYMMISPDSARIYVNETAAKGTKGGFAIGGFSTVKGTTNKFMLLTPSNYFIGHNSGQLITSGTYNSTLGYESGKALVGGSNNIFIGYKSGIGTVGGGSNVFIGTQAGYSNISGNYNIVLGRQAGYSTTASSNIFVGDLTAWYNSTGYQNVMIGDWAGYHNTTGWQNIFLGAQAGWYNSTGTNNIFLGYNAGYNNTIGHDNISIGNLAGESNIDGIYNIMIGSSAGNLNTTGDYNSLIGYQAGEKTTGNWNTMLGYLSGNSNTTAGSQVLIGYQAGMGNTGGWNTMVGSLAGSASGTGTENTYIGLAAGQNVTGNNNVFIGRWAGAFEPATNSNKLIIESLYGSTDNLNNALIYGDFSAKYLKVNGQIMNSVVKYQGYAADFKNTGGTTGYYGVNITAGSSDGSGTNYMIDFNSGGTWKGSIVLTNSVVNLYTVSDARLKENITTTRINALKILNDMQVVDYNFTKSPGPKHTGYIAQDVQKVLPEMVIYNEKADEYAISTATLIPILHKAIQEQQKEIEELKALVNKLLLNQAK